jgi:hypothetical protein
VAAGAVFLLVALIGVYGVLKFLGCMRPCYNCKKCTFGMGRLSALYFGKRSIKDYKETYGVAVAIFFFTLLGPFPIAILAISAFQTFALTKIMVLLFLSAFTLFSVSTWRMAPGKNP